MGYVAQCAASMWPNDQKSVVCKRTDQTLLHFPLSLELLLSVPSPPPPPPLFCEINFGLYAPIIGHSTNDLAHATESSVNASWTKRNERHIMESAVHNGDY